MFFRGWFTVTLVLWIFAFHLTQCQEWSWGKDESKSGDEKDIDSNSAPDKSGRTVARGRKLETNNGKDIAGDLQGRTFGFLDKISCKIGLKCKHQQNVPFIEVPSHLGPVGPLPLHAGPAPVIAPLPIPIAPVQPILPNQGYPPIKPSKTEHHHHHLHTHIHKGSGPIAVSPFKDTGYPPSKKDGFTPTIISGSARPIGLGGVHSNLGVNPIAVQPEIVTGQFSHPVASLYPQKCVCVLPHLCSPLDIVRRSGSKDIAHLLNPRNEGVSILSNATVEEKIQRSKRDSDATKRESKSLLDDSVEGRAFGLGGHAPGLTGCSPNYVCCRNGFNKPIPNSHPICGKSYKSSIHGRVANTDYDKGTTQFGQYPWQGAILRDEQYNNVFVCGATLVSSRHVLTAAHCIADQSPYTLKVRLGDWDVNGVAEFYKHVEFPVERVTIHPEFYPGNLNNDIAVITLKGYINLKTSPHISPVCLPSPYKDYTHQQCFVTGWGKDAFGYKGQFQQILKEVDVPVVDRQTCQYSLQQARLGPDYYLPKGFICAGGQHGKDTCEGDGGGPLVCPTSSNTYELAGIVSWGIECGLQGVPGVYVNVPYYVDWIKAQINY